MCSVGWADATGGYRLWFNRDEQWSRPLSTDPEIIQSARVPILCAQDPAGGGTWLATNAAGVSIAVLNHYDDALRSAPGRLSRGKIPFTVGLGRTSAEVVAHLQNLAWADYAACWVLLLAPRDKARLWLWNGDKLFADMPLGSSFFTTSSVDPATICMRRRQRFEALRDCEDWSAIFDETDPENPAAGIFMTRSDAGTVSQTSVEVIGHRVSFSVRRRGENFLEITTERAE